MLFDVNKYIVEQLECSKYFNIAEYGTALNTLAGQFVMLEQCIRDFILYYTHFIS